MTLGRLGRVVPTLETGPSGLFLELGILQRKDRSQGLSPLRPSSSETLKVRVAPGQAGKEEHLLEAPGSQQASQNPHLDPLRPKNQIEALVPAVRVQSPLGLTLKEQASQRSPKPITQNWQGGTKCLESLRDSQSLLVPIYST